MPLRRTYSAPGAIGKGSRGFVTPRSRSKAAAATARKASRSKTVTKQRSAKLAKVTAKAAYDIALKASLDVKEEKYFDVAADGIINFTIPATGGTFLANCGVVAFSTTVNDVANSATPMDYGGTGTAGSAPVQELKMLNAFATGANSMDGHYAVPASATNSWTIQRNPNSLTEMDTSWPINAQDDWYTQAPMRIRIIRVTPKLAKGTATAIEPNTDLFLDQHGNEQGIMSGVSTFTQVDLEHSPVNNRKYTVLGDTKFTLTDPFNITPVWLGQATQNHYAFQPTYAPGTSLKVLETKHQLAEKRGGRVYYGDPAAVEVPSSGHRREYIFMHAWYVNVGSLPNITPIRGHGVEGTVLSVMHRTTSTFKDV